MSLILNEFGDFPMMRRMLLTIRERAETQATAGSRDASSHAMETAGHREKR